MEPATPEMADAWWRLIRASVSESVSTEERVMVETRRFRFTPLWMRRLGVTKENLLRHMRDLEAAGELPQTAEELDVTDAVKVGGQLLLENASARCEADKAGADWSAFFEAILALLVQLMPYIIKDRQNAVAKGLLTA
jgi:hypothetical protein